MSCDDKTIVGNDLLNSEEVLIGFTDTISITGKTILGDVENLKAYRTASTIENRSAITPRRLLLGSIDDNIFGTYSSEVYFEARIFGNATLPDYSEAVMDSLVLIIALDSLGQYGEMEAQDIEVFKVIEDISEVDSFIVSDMVETDPDPIGRVSNIVLNPGDSLTILDHDTGEPIKVRPQLRIRLDNSFAAELFTDTIASQGDTEFRQFLPGLKLVSSAQNSMVGLLLNLENTTTFASALRMYYTEQDTLENNFNYFIGGAQLSSMTHDFSPTLETAIDDTAIGEEELYIQGMIGPSIELNLDGVKELSDKLINKAELTVYVKEENTETDLYPPVEDILISRYNENDQLLVIDDIITALGVANVDADAIRELIFGGNLVEDDESGVTIRKYSFNITGHIQYLHDNPDDRHDIVLSTLSRIDNPNRTVLYGTEHPEFAPELRVTFTNP